jgi:hypothetical protein
MHGAATHQVAGSAPAVLLQDRAAIAAAVDRALQRQPVLDMHTHLYPPAFGECMSDPRGLMLWGIDEMLTYHYLIAEVMRTVSRHELTAERFYALPRREQADLIWKKLFVERSPVSEACRGVLTSLHALGLDTRDRDLSGLRRWFAQQSAQEQIDRVMALARVESITMTNDVFDDHERARWLCAEGGPPRDPRFRPALRIDPLVVDWTAASQRLCVWGYPVERRVTGPTLDTVRRFLEEWIDRMKPDYLAVSLPPTFRFPAETQESKVLTWAILPTCADRGLPLAMMIGVERGVNPALRTAGDMGFAADVRSVVELAVEFPENRFLVTMLSRENQHELAVAARKCGNLMPFGCWWHLNNPSLVQEITRMRLELLGTCFIPQHSDCRVLEQLIYKWDHSRRVIGGVLTDKYADVAETGWALSLGDIERDVRLMLSENYTRFVARDDGASLRPAGSQGL